MPSQTAPAAPGSVNVAVPTATAVAPASISSIASFASYTPPIARIGRFEQRCASYTAFTATGCTHRPESPPVRLPSTGRRVSTSITIAGIVLMSASASAPFSAHAAA